MIFILTLINGEGQKEFLTYDGNKNQFFTENGEPLIVHKQQLEEPLPYTIRIYTGKNCNARCEYCLQQDHRKEIKNKMSIKDLVSEIVRVTDGHPVERIHLWGGEPLLYFEECKEYVNTFNELRPNNDYKFMTSTNGILLKDLNIQKWLYDNIYRLQISWDGPGQHLRGIDPLQDKSIVQFVKKMIERDSHSVIFSPVMTKSNRCLYKYKQEVQKIIGTDNFIMGPARLLLPLDEKMTKHAITDIDELDQYASNLRDIIIQGKINPQWDFIKFYVNMMYGTLGSKFVPHYCPSENDYFMMVDQNGKILTCTNVESDAENDEHNIPASMGHISELKNGARLIADYPELKAKRKRLCEKCIIYSLCEGGCPRIPNNLLESYCNSRIAELLPVFIAILHAMTGKVLVEVTTI